MEQRAMTSFWPLPVLRISASSMPHRARQSLCCKDKTADTRALWAIVLRSSGVIGQEPITISGVTSPQFNDHVHICHLSLSKGSGSLTIENFRRRGRNFFFYNG
jgi:hypothetical protein